MSRPEPNPAILIPRKRLGRELSGHEARTVQETTASRIRPIPTSIASTTAGLNRGASYRLTDAPRYVESGKNRGLNAEEVAEGLPNCVRGSAGFAMLSPLHFLMKVQHEDHSLTLIRASRKVSLWGAGSY